MEQNLTSNLTYSSQLMKTPKQRLPNSKSLRLHQNPNTQKIKKMMDKLNKLSDSIDISSLNKNPLNLIQYEMQGEKCRHDPQMVLAKLRNLQNRAEIHRAQNQIHLLSQQKSLQKQKIRRSSTSKKQPPYKTKQFKQSYLKIYQSYLKQKQLQAEKKQRYNEDEEDDIMKKYDEEDLTEAKNGLKYFNALKKHPKLLDLTISRKQQMEGFTLLQERIKKKLMLIEKLKNKASQDQYTSQKALQKERLSQRYFENPQKIIEKQLTKFYVKKNPGKLTDEAQINERSQSLLRKQKQIVISIDENKISKEDKQKLQAKINQLANQLAKSDRRRSLQGLLLPQLKQNSECKYKKKQGNLRRKLFNQTDEKESSKLLPIQKIIHN